MSKELQTLPIDFVESTEITIPEVGARPSMLLSKNSINEGYNRLVEARVVNMSTYSDLEYVFNEGYREAKANLSVVGYEITVAQREVRRIKGEYILDVYPGFLKERGLKDNAANREAFLERQADYVAAMDRVALLTAMQNSFEGNVKVFENVCRFMRKEMDLLIRSGAINPNKY